MHVSVAVLTVGVAYDTAQHAVRTLEAEGLVVRYPGRGYYITGRG